MSAVLCSEETRGQRGALAEGGRGAVWTLPVGQVSSESRWFSSVMI